MWIITIISLVTFIMTTWFPQWLPQPSHCFKPDSQWLHQLMNTLIETDLSRQVVVYGAGCQNVRRLDAATFEKVLNAMLLLNTA